MKRRERRHRLGLKTHLATIQAREAAKNPPIPEFKQTSPTKIKQKTGPIQDVQVLLYAIQNLSQASQMEDQTARQRKYHFVRTYFRSLPQDLQNIVIKTCNIIESLDDRAKNMVLECNIFMQEQRQLRRLYCLPSIYFTDDTSKSLLIELDSYLTRIFHSLRDRYHSLADSLIVTSPEVCIMPDINKNIQKRPYTAQPHYARPKTSHTTRSIMDANAQNVTYSLHEIIQLLSDATLSIDELKDKYIQWKRTNITENKSFPSSLKTILSIICRNVCIIHINSDEQMIISSTENNEKDIIQRAGHDFEQSINELKKFFLMIERKRIKKEIDDEIGVLLFLVIQKINKVNSRKQLDEAIYTSDIMKLEAAIHASKLSGIDTSRAEEYLVLLMNNNNNE